MDDLRWLLPFLTWLSLLQVGMYLPTFEVIPSTSFTRGSKPCSGIILFQQGEASDACRRSSPTMLLAEAGRKSSPFFALR